MTYRKRRMMRNALVNVRKDSVCVCLLVGVMVLGGGDSSLLCALQSITFMDFHAEPKSVPKKVAKRPSLHHVHNQQVRYRPFSMHCWLQRCRWINITRDQTSMMLFLYHTSILILLFEKKKFNHVQWTLELRTVWCSNNLKLEQKIRGKSSFETRTKTRKSNKESRGRLLSAWSKCKKGNSPSSEH
jgi:hypothetical protein